ncbi:unnamed protein product [Rhizoctonia solani]|uniref:Uncharacterized protein n=1 Tax=Rhizoctonia solani TaxID=456999 RepID=A0A8H3BZ54_9AGAM|nr:unnamed protein product [Rhizoctonia solani]
MEDPDDAKLTMGKGMVDVFLTSLRQLIGADKVDTLIQVRPDPNLPPGARVPPPEVLAKAIEADADLDEQIARPGHIRNLATAPPKGVKAPEPPRDPRVGIRFSKEMERLQLEEPEALNAELKEIDAALTRLETHMNPFVRKARQYMLNAHHTGMFIIVPNIPEENHFDTENIIQYGINTLVLRITRSRSPEGGPIRSSTAIQWMTHHTYNICTYTRDPQTGNRTGLTVLRQGFLKRMEDAVRWCVFTYGLVRHAKIQRSLDRTAVQLIMESLIHRTRFRGRAGAIQTMLAMSLAMFGGLRAGTLQANHKEYRDKEMYLKWGDITLNVIAFKRWSATINFDHWKGFSDMEGHRKTLTFGPVTKAHNTIFEPVLLLLVDGMGRGVFEDISNPKELFAYQGTVIKIKSEFKKTPVFVKRSSRGLKLIEHEPAPPHQLAGIMNHECRVVGIEGGGLHALRRGAGRLYIISLGRDYTQYMLNHNDRTGKVMDNHYTVGLKDHDLVGIYLQEGETTSHLSYNQKKALEKAKLATQGMSLLLCRVQTTNPTLHSIINEDSEQKKARQEDEEKALEEIPLIQSLRETAETAWSAFIELVPETYIPYDHLATGKKIANLMKKVPDEKQMLAAARADTFRSANLRLQEGRRQALKNFRRKVQDLKIKDIPDATFQERDAAAKMIDEESLIIAEVKAWKLQKRETNEYLSSKENPLRLEISKDQAATFGIPETIRQELANLPESNDDDSSDGEESEPEVTEDHDPLEATNSLPVPEKTTSDKPSISSIDINLQRPLNLSLDAELEEPERVLDEPFDDSDEPKVLPIDTDVSRGETLEFYWEPLQEQKEKRAKGKGKGKDTAEAFAPTRCNLCETMPWRPQTIFKLLSNLERHKREEHDEWGNLELQMATDDPKVFKCPGCDKRFNKISPCKTHCWKYCDEKERFLPLKLAHDDKRPGRAKDTAKQQDDRQEEGETGIEIQSPDYGRKMARDIHTEFTKEPGVLQSWADRVGGVTQENTGGASVEDIQQSFGRVAGLAGGRPYHGPPIPPADDLDDIPELTTPDNPNITTIGPDFMKSTRDRMALAMKKEMEMNPSDYEETDEEEQGSGED